MVNRVILVGNLGKDPEIRTLENGAKVAKFSIATNENYRDKSGEWQQQTEWHDIVAWRALADRAESGLNKGDAIYLEGKLSTRTWQDQNGNNRRTTEVVANYFRIINRNSSSSGSGGSSEGGGYFPGSNDEPTSVVSDSSSNDSAADADGADDLPF
ncbi:MAG TPA: single-stranded DNA-binding protein [Saprospiraceae bacterium]|nr:single-stranded DNA-binding protein [Saprospiraceae bacterium]